MLPLMVTSFREAKNDSNKAENSRINLKCSSVRPFYPRFPQDKKLDLRQPMKDSLSTYLKFECPLYSYSLVLIISLKDQTRIRPAKTKVV